MATVSAYPTLITTFHVIDKTPMLFYRDHSRPMQDSSRLKGKLSMSLVQDAFNSVRGSLHRLRKADAPTTSCLWCDRKRSLPRGEQQQEAVVMKLLSIRRNDIAITRFELEAQHETVRDHGVQEEEFVGRPWRDDQVLQPFG